MQYALCGCNTPLKRSDSLFWFINTISSMIRITLEWSRWCVIHLCTSIDWLSLKFYCLHTQFIVRLVEIMAYAIYIWERVSWGDPLTTVAYGLGVPPLIYKIKEVMSDFPQYWYANDTSWGGCFSHIHESCGHLSTLVPYQDQSPDTTKSILVTGTHNLGWYWL